MYKFKERSPTTCPVFLNRSVHIGKILDSEKSTNLDKNFKPHFISYNFNSYVKITYLLNIGDPVFLCIMETEYFTYMHQTYTFDIFRVVDAKSNYIVSSTQNFYWPRPQSLEI